MVTDYIPCIGNVYTAIKYPFLCKIISIFPQKADCISLSILCVLTINQKYGPTVTQESGNHSE